MGAEGNGCCLTIGSLKMEEQKESTGTVCAKTLGVTFGGIGSFYHPPALPLTSSQVWVVKKLRTERKKGFVLKYCQIRVDGATSKKKEKQRHALLGLIGLGGVFFLETGAVYIKNSPFKGMLVRYFLF